MPTETDIEIILGCCIGATIVLIAALEGTVDITARIVIGLRRKFSRSSGG